MQTLPRAARFWIPRVLASAIGFACTLTAMSVGWHLLDSIQHPCPRRRVQGTKIHLMSIQGTAEIFVAEHGRCPQNIEEAAKADDDIPPDRSWMEDGWGEKVLLACILTDDGPVVAALSAGPDRKFGSNDDLSSAELK